MILKFGCFQWGAPERQVCINYFIVGFILLPIYIKFMGVLSQILSFPTTLTTYLYYGVLWLLLLSGIKGILKQAANAVNVAVLFAAIIAFEMFLHPTSVKYIVGGNLFSFVTFQPFTMLPATLFVFVGLAVLDFEDLGMLLHKGARIGVIGAVLTYAMMLVWGIPIQYDDMSAAYGICPVVCILVAYQERKDWMLITLGIICLVLAGTRGPIVCLIAALMFRFIIFEENFRRKICGVIICVFAGVLIFSGLGFLLLAILEKFLSGFGITSLRFLDYLNAGMFLSGSSRGNFASILFDAIKEQPILGYGIGGDRLILERAYPGRFFYAHNLALEALVAFGVIGGRAFLLWVAYLSLGVLTSPKTYIRKMGIGLFCGIIVKLFLSSSFILSCDFFLFLGLCMAAGIASKRGEKIESEE